MHNEYATFDSRPPVVVQQLINPLAINRLAPMRAEASIFFVFAKILREIKNCWITSRRPTCKSSILKVNSRSEVTVMLRAREREKEESDRRPRLRRQTWRPLILVACKHRSYFALEYIIGTRVNFLPDRLVASFLHG